MILAGRRGDIPMRPYPGTWSALAGSAADELRAQRQRVCRIPDERLGRNTNAREAHGLDRIHVPTVRLDREAGN